MSANASDVIPDSALASVAPAPQATATSDIIPLSALGSSASVATPLAHPKSNQEIPNIADTPYGNGPFGFGSGLRGNFSGVPANLRPVLAKAESLPSGPLATAAGIVGAMLIPGGEPVGRTPEPGIPNATAQFDTAPLEGGLPSTAQTARTDVLQRVGLDKARQSAIEGNAKDAATDFQLTKFDEPAGVEAKAQFDAEKMALQSHAQGIIKDTGGTLGTDEDSLDIRGQTMARPFDDLRDWFSNQKRQLYAQAAARAAGKPNVDVSAVDNLLKDPDFTETLLAKDQGGLLGSMQRQWDRFKTINPQGLDPAGAENYRKWLNQVWTPQNSATLGQVKATLDDAVFKGAGEDIYGPARQLTQMEHQTLDNPNGISKLFDADPKNPLNRATPYAKIPDTLTRLDPQNFSNVLKTLDTMPEEIQPAAQAAKSEIKAHLANKVLDAGASTQGPWNAPAVSKVLKANSAKVQSAFADQADVLSKIQDLDSAGKILQVNQSSPGAAAQAANALKRGMMSRVISKAASATGALVGSGAGAVVGAPGLGAAAGAGVGESVGASLGQGMAEKAALNRWRNNIVDLTALPTK